MANYQNTSDLKQDVLLKSGELTDGTSEYDTLAIQYINRAQQAMVSGALELGLDVGEPYPWALNKYPSVLTLQPPNTSFTFNLTNGSTAGTFNSAPTTSFLNWYILLNDFAECYRIASHSANSASFTIDGPFNNATSTTPYPGQMLLLDYTLDANVLRLVAPFTTYRNTTVLYNDAGQIAFTDFSNFARQFPINQLETGTPNMASEMYKDSTTMTPTIRINRIPDQQLRVEYNYVPIPPVLVDDPTSIPIIPYNHRITLSHYATYYLLLDKNDQRSAEYRELTKAGMMALKREMQQQKILSNPNYGSMIARPDLVPERRRLWWQYFV